MSAILSKCSNFFRSFRYGDRLQPVRDWFVLVTIGVILLLMSLAWNTWLFSRVTNGEAIGTATSTPALTTTSIDSVTALFQKRADIETQYKNGHFVDPSL